MEDTTQKTLPNQSMEEPSTTKSIAAVERPPPSR
ncbi:uncharacterized protein G2W53_028024 [Senna tora]|uniref:Uncharacterized protein n=1 Tax=Senna tora TaxID=362788 RepID=A0A834W8A3_9FABA|nr:uncharacterized protein G2W53_028024 [Senna tora]